MRFFITEPVVLSRSSQVVNVGFSLRRRIDAVARREQLDGTAFERRVLLAAVMAREAGMPERDESDRD